MSRDVVARRLGRPLAGAAVAFAGMLAFWAYAAWSVRNDVPRPFVGTVSVVVALAVWLLVGLVAGLVSGRFRDAVATWVASVVALATAVVVARAVDPDWPTGDLPVEASLAFTGIAMLPLVAGGHLVGAWIARRSGRSRGALHEGGARGRL